MLRRAAREMATLSLGNPMKRLFAAAAAAPLCFAASQALAQTTISTATTTPLATSTAGDINIDINGSVVLSGGGVGVNIVHLHIVYL